MSDQEKSQDLFSSFMKKKIASQKKGAEVKAVVKNKTEKKKDNSDPQSEGADDDQNNDEEMTEEEELEEAKKESRNKAAETDQTEMFKKLIMENVVKYAVVIAVLLIFAFAVIKFGAAFLAMVNGLIYKVLMGGLGAK